MATMQSINEYLSKQAEKLEIDLNFLLSMADGKVLASSLNDEQKASRHSAMSSALLALSESFSKEVMGQENRELTISCETGHAVIVRVTQNKHAMMLCLTCSLDANLAQLLRLARDTAIKIKKES